MGVWVRVPPSVPKERSIMPFWEDPPPPDAGKVVLISIGIGILIFILFALLDAHCAQGQLYVDTLSCLLESK